MKNSTKACHNGFDLDLYSWWPESRDIIAPIGPMPLYTLGEIADDGKFVSACYWNAIGSLFFTVPPPLEKSPDGWTTFRGMTTKNELVEVTAEHAIRWLFVQGYPSLLNCEYWTQHNNVALDLCGCVRGYAASEVKWASVRERAKRWLDSVIKKAQTTAGV